MLFRLLLSLFYKVDISVYACFHFLLLLWCSLERLIVVSASCQQPFRRRKGWSGKRKENKGKLSLLDSSAVLREHAMLFNLLFFVFMIFLCVFLLIVFLFFVALFFVFFASSFFFPVCFLYFLFCVCFVASFFPPFFCSLLCVHGYNITRGIYPYYIFLSRVVFK